MSTSMRAGPSTQRGVVLIVGLIMLLLMTMLGLAAMQSTNQQERMAGNMRDRDLAFQAAEAALREGEGLISTGNEATAGNAFFNVPRTYAQLTEDANWDAGNTDSVAHPGFRTAEIPAANQPRFKIEQLQEVDRSLDPTSPDIIDYFRVTARAQGGRADTVVILQITESRPEN